MKRISTTALGSLALLLPMLGGCELDLPVDDAAKNPGVFGPTGVVRGTLSYLGPPPCFKNGSVEGAVIILLFAYNNPGPPDGLATSALNFSTVPGAKLFQNIAAPTDGPGSTKQPGTAYCPSVNSPFVNAATEWSMQQIPAGSYQIRAFYSRENRFNPLFNFANLPLAGDTPGGALENPLAVPTRFAKIDVGLPDKDGKLVMPAEGFLREGVPISMGGALKSNRPFFHLDYGRSVSWVQPAPLDPAGVPLAADYATNWEGQRKKYTPEEAAKLGYVTFPQDHLSTSRSNGACLGDRDPACDIFEFAQGSFPTLRFKFGFPEGNDAWVMKNARPKEVFSKEKSRAFYGIDPKEFVGDIPSSGGFAITRNFNAAGEPDIIRDNTSLETIAQLADIFPSVVLSKMVEDGEGNVAMPPRSQTDPVVVIQTIPLLDWASGSKKGEGTMKATSQNSETGGGLSLDLATTAGGPDTSNPLFSRTGMVTQDGLTAMIRPSVVCIYPQVDLRGTLVTPVQKDPHPKNLGAALVEKDKILKYKGNRVKDIKYGCLPPGHYSVNVVHATGQAWSFPNLSGICSYSGKFEPNEDCMTTNKDLTGGFLPKFSGVNEVFKPIGGVNKDAGFPYRPLVKSQMAFQTDEAGKPLTYTDPNTKQTYFLPQVVVVKPSPRCGKYMVESDPTNVCTTDADCKNAPFSGVCIPGPGDKKFCDYNADKKISTSPVWFNNPENEDTLLDDPKTGKVSDKSANGVLDAGEDKNDNKVMDLRVPNTCALPYAAYTSVSKIAGYENK